MDFDKIEKDKRDVANMRNVRTLSLADVENHIVSAIEELADNYQFFEWKPVNDGLERLRALVKKRLEEDKILEKEEKTKQLTESPLLEDVGINDNSL